MSYAERHVVALTTNASGAVTAFTPPVTGRIAAVIYTKGNFDNGADLTITVESTTQSLWTDTDVNASETVYPLAVGNLGTGAASTLTEVPIFVANDRVKVVVAQGGNAKTGTITVIVA
jgi:hypothetical protein